MDREQLIKALYNNWMNNYFKEDQDIISIEKKILNLIQTTSDDPDIQAKLIYPQEKLPIYVMPVR